MNAADAREPGPPGPALSVIVCCFNSSERITATLDHLRRQVVPDGFTFEIIVVDNNSEDGTAEVATRAWAAPDSRIRFAVVSESRQGLSYARERGLAEAHAEIVVFVDDDNWIAPDYLGRVSRLMAQHPRAALLGGSITPVFERAEPAWFQDVQGIFAVGDKGVKARVQPLGHTVPGAGMALRKAALQDLRSRQFEFSLNDRAGRALSGGGDIELNLALQLCGWDIHYDPELRLQHFIPERRLTWRYACGLVRGMGEAEVFLQPYRYLLRKRAGTLPALSRFGFLWTAQLALRSAQTLWWRLRAFLAEQRLGPITWASITAQRYASFAGALWRHRLAYRGLFRRVEELFP